MTNEERNGIIKKAFENQDVFEFMKVDEVNHKPHPYCITGMHIKHSGGMYLNIENAEKHGAKCGVYTSPNGQWDTKSHKGWERCKLPHSEHTSDKAAFLKLRRNASNDEVGILLKIIMTEIPEGTIDGFALVETPEKFRIS